MSQVGDRRRLDADGAEGQIPRGLPAQKDSGQKQQPPEDMDEQVAESRRERLRSAAKPDQKDGGKGHQLPEQEEDDIIAGVEDPQGTGHVEPGGDMVGVLLDVQAVEGGDQAHQGHDDAEDLAQAVHPSEGEGHLQKGNRSVNARLPGPGPAARRAAGSAAATPSCNRSGIAGRRSAPGKQHESRMDPETSGRHRSNPPGS